MTTPAAAGQPAPGDLTARLFRALYPRYDLHALAGPDALHSCGDNQRP